MRFPKHVSITRDFNAWADYIPVLPSVHDQLLIEPAPPFLIPVPVGPFLELTSPMFWPPGWAMGKHKLTRTVFHNQLTIALKGHDIGVMLPHIPIPLNEVLFILHTLNSERKARFEAGEVKANGSPIACCTVIDWAVIPTPMTYCAKVPIPESGTGTALLFNSLIVGMHWIDMVAGWLEICLQILFAALKWSAFNPPTFTPAEFQTTENVPGLAGGLIRLAGQQWFDYHGDAELAWTVVSGWAGEVKISATRSGEDGRLSGGVSRRLGPDGLNVHGSANVREGRPGEDSVVGEFTGGANVGDGTYEGQIDTMGRGGGKVEHPEFTSGGNPFESGANPLEGGFIPSWDDLPSL